MGHSGINYLTAIWRYNTDGTLDTTFNSIGYTVFENIYAVPWSEAGGISIDSNGKIIVVSAIYESTNNDNMVVFRYNSNGTLDTSFNGIGYMTHDGLTAINKDSGRSFVIDSSGKIVVVGETTTGSSSSGMIIWRIHP